MASRALAVWVGILAITVAPHAHALTEPSPYLGHLTVGEAQLGTTSCAKRGVGWGFIDPRQLAVLKGLTWWYDWGLTSNEGALAEGRRLGIEYVPMQWGQWYVKEIDPDSIPLGVHVLLGYNEPNHGGSAALPARQAAALWPYLEAAADKLGLRLGSPAAAPCGADCVEPNPFKWWDDFFYWCKGCRVDFLATHYYACNADWLTAYLAQCKKYGLPIWLTEWACPNPSGSFLEPRRYMRQTLALMDADPDIERYAWFAVDDTEFQWLGPSNSLLNQTTNTLTRLGELYTDCVPPSAAAPEELPAQAPAEIWAALCGGCTDAVRAKGGLAALSPERRQYCGERCGFWADARKHPRA